MMQFSDDPGVAERQMQAIICYLTAFGYIDGNFDLNEKTFVKDYIRRLVERRVAELPLPDPAQRGPLTSQFTTHFHAFFDRINHEVKISFTEVTAHGEDLEKFVYAKLKLHAFEIFKSFDDANQRQLLATVDELIHADGVAHPREQKFRAELSTLLRADYPPVQLAQPPAAAGAAGPPEVSEPISLRPAQDNHGFFEDLEHHYSRDPQVMQTQASHDLTLIQQAMQIWEKQREAGKGRLARKRSVAELAGSDPFLDGHTYSLMPKQGQDYELITLGDTHGCYSCLKASVLQSDFLRKCEAYWKDPAGNPDPKLVLIGDFIDRGIYSFNGVMRLALKLFIAAPDHVYLLRGNHEYFVYHQGRVRSGVQPAEAISTMEGFFPPEMFQAYLHLFESMPHALLFDRTLFVHGGIPRDTTIEQRWKDLSSLNDPDIRFQMLWSDPSRSDFVPRDLQMDNARFPFGRKQFKTFMGLVGANTMIRGHEKVNEGFRKVYDDREGLLINLFSAGGSRNDDVPEGSSYRGVTPMACTFHVKGGRRVITPWAIDYTGYVGPARNNFYRLPSQIPFRA